MANIWIEGHGVFSLANEKVQDLVSWLASNQAVQSEGASEQFGGQQLLNEGEPAPPKSNIPPPDGRQINDPGANVNNPKPKLNPDGSGTYDYGGTWI